MLICASKMPSAGDARDPQGRTVSQSPLGAYANAKILTPKPPKDGT